MVEMYRNHDQKMSCNIFCGVLLQFLNKKEFSNSGDNDFSICKKAKTLNNLAINCRQLSLINFIMRL